MNFDIPVTDHALKRAAQRNLAVDEIYFVLEHGKPLHNAGLIFYQMRADSMPADLPPNHPCQRLVGTTVAVHPDARIVVTVYRNEGAFKEDRRKSKYNRRSRTEWAGGLSAI